MLRSKFLKTMGQRFNTYQDVTSIKRKTEKYSKFKENYKTNFKIL